MKFYFFKSGVVFLLIQIFLMPVLSKEVSVETFQSGLPVRVLKFPADRWALAEVYLMKRDVKGSQRVYKTAYRDLGPAKGKVYIPAGGAAGLVITMEGAENLSGLKDLEPNDIQYIRAHSIPLQSSDLKNFEHLKGLEQLVCEFTDLDDRALPFISQFKNMETLVLKHCNITDRNLELLNKMPKLKNLYLEYCPVTDDGIKKIALDSNLVTLGLEGTKVTDECVSHLVKMKKLESINIPAVSLSDEQLLRFSGSKALKHIKIGGKNITKEGIKRFREMRQDCSVVLYELRIPMEMLF